jgi:hypothetical protein
MLRRFGLAVGLAIPAMMLSSCAEDSVSIQVLCNIPPTIGVDGCVVVTGGDFCHGHGSANLALLREYRLTLEIQNNLFSREAMIPIVAEPNNVNIEEAEIEVLLPSGETVDFGDGLPNPFAVVTAGRVKIGGTGIAAIKGLPRDYLDALRSMNFVEDVGTIVLEVRIKGKTDGLTEVQAGVWRWPIDLFDVELTEQCIPQADAEENFNCRPGQDNDVIPFCTAT